MEGTIVLEGVRVATVFGRVLGLRCQLGEPAQLGGRHVSITDARRGKLGVQRLEGVSLRFGPLHGQCCPSTMDMARLVGKRCLPLIGAGSAVLSWIALEDAAAAVTLAVESSSPGQVYNVVDDQPVTFADYVNEMARPLGAKPPRARSKWLVRPFAS